MLNNCFKRALFQNTRMLWSADRSFIKPCLNGFLMGVWLILPNQIDPFCSQTITWIVWRPILLVAFLYAFQGLIHPTSKHIKGLTKLLKHLMAISPLISLLFSSPKYTLDRVFTIFQPMAFKTIIFSSHAAVKELYEVSLLSGDTE